MLPRLVSQFTRRSIFRAACLVHVTEYKENSALAVQNLHKQCPTDLSLIKRYKHSKKKTSKPSQAEDSDEDEDEEEELETDSSTKTITATVNSLRLDVVAKTGLGMPRNKVETAFYESRLRVNGLKIHKKSMQVAIGDEIDVVQSRSIDNPNFLVVSRTVLLSAQEASGGYKVKLSRDKKLLIENYEDAWQGQEVQ